MPDEHHFQQISKKIGGVKTNPYERNGSRMARGVIMASYYKNSFLTLQVVMVVVESWSVAVWLCGSCNAAGI